MEDMKKYREFLKSGPWDRWHKLETAQKKKMPPPPVQKPYPKDVKLIDLIPYEEFTIGDKPLKELIKNRRSRRKYTKEYLDIEELSFLLWATQGLSGRSKHFRSSPSAGARHPFETYLVVDRVKDLEKGMYRYLPIEHKLLFIYKDDKLQEKMVDACLGQTFVGDAAVIFIWSVIPYRTEWRYSILSHKVIAIDAGHVCENLYLASEAIGAGTCGVGAYAQEKIDKIIKVDGEDEFTIYLAPVGKVDHNKSKKP